MREKFLEYIINHPACSKSLANPPRLRNLILVLEAETGPLHRMSDINYFVMNQDAVGLFRQWDFTKSLCEQDEEVYEWLNGVLKIK